MIAAYAALTAIGTPVQAFQAFGQPVVFVNITTEVGVTTTGTIAEFVCPSTALYFVYYRLRAFSIVGVCFIDLIVPGSATGIPVSFVKAWRE